MFDTIIIDEATRIANPNAKQTKEIKKLKATHKYALTGTPLSNSIQNIWSIMDFCQPGLLGTYWMFTQKYCTTDRFGNITGYKNLSDLKKHISDYMIRRKKSDVLHELPDLLYETVYVELSPEERKIYNAVKNEITVELKEYKINRVLGDKSSNPLTMLIRLKQAANSLELVSDHKLSSKTNALKEILKDIMHENAKAIIFTQFSEMADLLMRDLKEYQPVLISGKVEREERHQNINAFQKNDKNKIIIMTEAGGMGINLQRATYVIHYDCPWSIAKMEQRDGRAHRSGQTSNVTVFRLIAQDTIDEYILKVLHKKQKLSENILGDAETVKKVKLSKYDIKKILS